MFDRVTEEADESLPPRLTFRDESELDPNAVADAEPGVEAPAAADDGATAVAEEAPPADPEAERD